MGLLCSRGSVICGRDNTARTMLVVHVSEWGVRVMDVAGSRTQTQGHFVLPGHEPTFHYVQILDPERLLVIDVEPRSPAVFCSKLDAAPASIELGMMRCKMDRPTTVLALAARKGLAGLTVPMLQKLLMTFGPHCQSTASI